MGGVASQECSLSLNLKDGDELYIRVWMRQSAITPLGFLMDRAIDQMTLMVYGKSESAAIQALRKTYATTRQDFVILELNWQN